MKEDKLQDIETMLNKISPYPWRCEKTVPGEWWITSPDDSDHESRADFEPIYESSGTVPQLGIDGDFIAQSPEIVRELISVIRRTSHPAWNNVMECLSDLYEEYNTETPQTSEYLDILMKSYDDFLG